MKGESGRLTLMSKLPPRSSRLIGNCFLLNHHSLSTYILVQTRRATGIVIRCRFILKMWLIVLILYPEYNFAFLFDHSQGHVRKQNGAATKCICMSKNFGGTQPVMRDTTILADEGYLGPNSSIFRVGEIHN